MALSPYTVTALADSDANGTDGKNIVSGAVITLTDTNGNTATVYDDSAGTNPSTAKTTNTNGQRVIYAESGEYTLTVNGEPSNVVIGAPQNSTAALIASNRNYQSGDIYEADTGYYGDGIGIASWIAQATTGLTPSQSPADRGAAELVDGSGRLWKLISRRTITAESLGAKGDGSTEDTLVFAALTSWLESFGSVVSGQGVVLKPGSTYMIDTWKLPKFSSGGKRVYIGCPSGMATIKKIATANTAYMVAPAKYVENLAFADTGFHFQNIEFDGDGNVDNPFICRSFNSYHDNCRFLGGNVRNALLTRLSANGTDCASTLSETRFENCDFEATGTTSNALFKSEGSVSGHPADIYFIGNTMQGNAIAPYCCDFSKTNGWHINDNHTYNAVNEDILIRNLGRIGSFSGNQMEEGAYINVDESPVVNFGPGNTTWNDVTIAFPGAAPNYDAFIQNWFFRLRKDGGDTARLINIGTIKGHVVHSRDNVFEGNRFDNHVSNSGGRIFTSGDIDADGEIPIAVIPSTLKSVGLDIPTYTTAQLSDIANPVNTDNKYVGKGVYNTTNNTIYTSSGTAPGGGWISQKSGSSDITPV